VRENLITRIIVRSICLSSMSSQIPSACQHLIPASVGEVRSRLGPIQFVAYSLWSCAKQSIASLQHLLALNTHIDIS